MEIIVILQKKLPKSLHKSNMIVNQERYYILTSIAI